MAYRWKHLHPFQMVHFWLALTCVQQFSAISLHRKIAEISWISLLTTNSSLQFIQSVPITTKVVSSNPAQARCTVHNITLCDIVCQWLSDDRWFSPGTLVSSTNKTDRHDRTEILLKVALNTIALSLKLTTRRSSFSTIPHPNKLNMMPNGSLVENVIWIFLLKTTICKNDIQILVTVTQSDTNVPQTNNTSTSGMNEE